MTELPDYLGRFDNLEYRLMESHIGTSVLVLENLKAMGGGEVAELLTYLQDDGWTDFGPMNMVDKDSNGYLAITREEDR